MKKRAFLSVLLTMLLLGCLALSAFATEAQL